MSKFRKAMKAHDPIRHARMVRVEARGNLTRGAANVFSID